MIHSRASVLAIAWLATTVGADALGKKDEIGAIAPGLFADIIAVKGDPLADITEMQHVGFVVKAGAIYPADRVSK